MHIGHFNVAVHIMETKNQKWYNYYIKQQEVYSERKEIKAELVQGSLLGMGPVLYLLYTGNIPELENNTIATFADDTTRIILAVGEDHEDADRKLQNSIIGDWIWICTYKYYKEKKNTTYNK